MRIGARRERRRRRKRPIHHELSVRVRLCRPPLVAAPEDQRGENRGDRYTEPCAPSPARVGLHSWRQHALPHSARHDREESNGEEDAQRGEHASEPRRHLARGARHRHHRNHGGAGTRRSLDVHRELIGRSRHQPELGGMEFRITCNRRRRFGRRRTLQADVPLAGLHRHTMIGCGFGSEHPNRHLRAAWNHARQPHADAHVVGTSLPCKERIGTTDVAFDRANAEGERERS